MEHEKLIRLKYLVYNILHIGNINDPRYIIKQTVIHKKTLFINHLTQAFSVKTEKENTEYFHSRSKSYIYE